MSDDSLQNAYESAYDGMLSALEENRELTLEIESLRQRLEEMEKDRDVWKTIVKDCQDMHDAAMIAIGDILGVDVRDEPRCKWVSLRALDVVRRLEESEKDAKK